MTAPRIDVDRRTHADLFRILRTAGYRKHSATVVVTESTECSAGYWDGGSRTDTFLLHDNGATGPMELRTRVPFGDQSLPWSIECQTAGGYAIVKGGTFRGKAAHWTVYVHPDDVARFGVIPELLKDDDS